MTLNFTINDNSASYDGDPQCSKKKSKIFRSKPSLVDINTKYVTPLLYNVGKCEIDPTDSKRTVEKISKLLIDCSAPLLVPHVKTIKKKNKRNVYVRPLTMLQQLIFTVRLPLSTGRKKIFLMETKITIQNVGSIVSNYVIFSTKLKPKKSRNFAT